MARSMLWQIDMGDGTWSACCTGCRLLLGRGPRAAVARLARAHVCEPEVPLGRARRQRRPA
jgi:hypothetical protein